MESLEQRINYLEKILDVREGEKRIDPETLIQKTLFIDYKTKEIYKTQIQNIVTKLDEAQNLLINSKEIEKNYNVYLQKSKIIHENKENLLDCLNNLEKVSCLNKNFGKGAGQIIEVSHRSIENLKRELSNQQINLKEINEFQETLLENYQEIIDDYNTRIIQLDSVLSKK